MFEFIKRAYERGDEQIQVTFDHVLGFPAAIYLDPDPIIADDEEDFEFTNLTLYQ